MAELTEEQRAAAESRGKVIVSASAGSGKTFVMIEKLTRVIREGCDLDNILAVTFTKKAANQMKDKLRTALVAAVENAEGEDKARLKAQISRIGSADISTIHSFCARLLRTYFYALGIDGGFEIISDDDPSAKDLKTRAMENVFERRYEEGDSRFLGLVKRFFKKRSDAALKKLLLENYSRARTTAHYRVALENAKKLHTESGFDKVCAELSAIYSKKLSALADYVEKFAKNFPPTANAEAYAALFGEMRSALIEAGKKGIFNAAPALEISRKPHDGVNDRQAGELYKEFRKKVCDGYAALYAGISDRAEEFEKYLASCGIADVFTDLLLDFDDEYSRIKQEENKLDYNDLEHLTLELLGDEGVRREINRTYKYVFVDEYQDVNPVQEEIISAIDGEVFLVGDIKQAIYGFRGSKSLFFAEKYNRFYSDENGSALRLSCNFRSCKEVIEFVNKLFSGIMRENLCGFNYKDNSVMRAGDAYPEGSGFAGIHIFGKDKPEGETRGVYSVLGDGRAAPHTREGLAVLALVESELKGKRFDATKGEYVDTQPGDICILTRKNKGDSTEGIVRALTDAGYSVAGAQEPNICNLPEVKQLLDILSLIDNAAQDIPLVTAMLSPFGGFTEEELANIRISFKRQYKLAFRECVVGYITVFNNSLSAKIKNFMQKLDTYRDLAEILTAGELIDRILADSGMEAQYSFGGGEKLRNALRLAEEGPGLSLPAFLERIRAGEYNVSAPSAASSDSIKIMTMHAAKGLEFPVVIIADICRTFKGREYSELPFDDCYGFAPKLYDTENMITSSTLLRRLVKLRSDGEELKNELNLFYVACTRAMCRLHILASEIPDYFDTDAAEADCYADLFDLNAFSPDEITPQAEFEKDGKEAVILGEADVELERAIDNQFMFEYPHADSVDLPVKSSASAILKIFKADENGYAEHNLFGGEEETSTERGTAYHRFLELCDFSARSTAETVAQLEKFVKEGLMTEEQASLIDCGELAEILAMPVFSNLGGELYREKEFLCRLKACDILNSPADDFVLVQGAIDLLVKTADGARIIDYKYSRKNDERLAADYCKQLKLYRRAVSVIWKIPEEKIDMTIVNIRLRRQISL